MWWKPRSTKLGRRVMRILDLAHFPTGSMALNRQAAELERLRVACQVEPPGVVPKAQEVLRLMGVKCRPGALGRGELCRTLIAFDLACRALACPVPHKTAVKLSGVPEAVYAAALGTAQRLLGVQRRYTCQQIAKAVGGARVGIMASTELERYKERFLAAYPAKQVATIDLNSTVYSVCAFYLSAKKIKHPVDKQRLLELSLVGEAEFTSVCRSMLDLCYSTLGVSISDKPSADRLEQFEKNSASNKAHDRHQHQPTATSTDCTTPNMITPSTSTAPTSTTGNLGSFFRKSGSNPASSSSLLSMRRGASNGSSSRRPIPLTRLIGGGEPKNHVAALVRSIQAAAERKRHGGATITPVEPGGNNIPNNTIHDRTHQPAPAKRHRPTTPSNPASSTTAGTTATDRGGANHSGNVSSPSVASGWAGARNPPPVPTAPRAPLRNPYTPTAAVVQRGEVTIRPRSVTGSSGTGSGTVLRETPVDARLPSLRETPAPVAGGGAEKPAQTIDIGKHTTVNYGGKASAVPPCEDGNCSRSSQRQQQQGSSSVANGSSICSQGHSLGSEEGARARGEGYAEWKSRALASMENKMKESSTSASISTGAGGLHPATVRGSSDPVAIAASAAATVAAAAAPRGTARTHASGDNAPFPMVAGPTKQSSLKSFFSSSGGEENE